MKVIHSRLLTRKSAKQKDASVETLTKQPRKITTVLADCYNEAEHSPGALSSPMMLQHPGKFC